jgi:hypothetical protein
MAFVYLFVRVNSLDPWYSFINCLFVAVTESLDC